MRSEFDYLRGLMNSGRNVIHVEYSEFKLFEEDVERIKGLCRQQGYTAVFTAVYLILNKR